MPYRRSLPVPCAALAFLCLSFLQSANAQIVAFGASNVSGWNVAASDAFPAQLQAMLNSKGYRVRVLNAGIYGNTTTEMRARMERDIPRGTTIVVLDTSGGLYNDYGKGISRAEGDADMAAIEARLTARGIRILPVTTVDLPARYRQNDGVHLTPEGHRFVASRLLPQVMEALGARGAVAPSPQGAAPDVVTACRADARRLCSAVLGDDAKRHACMHDHRAELSRDCLSAIANSRDR